MRAMFTQPIPTLVRDGDAVVILDQTLSGQPLEDVANTPTDVVFRIYGRDISMGKGQGLLGMLSHVTAAARRGIAERAARG